MLEVMRGEVAVIDDNSVNNTLKVSTLTLCNAIVIMIIRIIDVN